MNAKSMAVPAGVAGKIFAVLSVATFWLLPFSPFVAIAALAATRHLAGWPRSLAKMGAVLTVLWVILIVALFLYIVLPRILNGSWDH